jgi:hypothetical protein
MLNCSLMRRLLLTALTLSLVGLGFSPLSICALLSSKAGECATPQTEARCERMEMEDSWIKVSAAPDASCCGLSQAPVPESQQNPSQTFLVSALAVVSKSVWTSLPRLWERRSHAVQDISPPLLHSFLCTFLI